MPQREAQENSPIAVRQICYRLRRDFPINQKEIQIVPMKIKSWQIGFLTFSLLLAGFLSGCASSGNYPTLRNTEVNVDWPMTRYRNAVSDGRVTTGMQQQVNQAYTAYKEGFDAALKAANTIAARTLLTMSRRWRISC